MDRRNFISALSGLAVSSRFTDALAQSGIGAQSVSSKDPFSTIDVHCHLFNARDLPIPGFVTNLYLSELPKIVRYPAGVVIWFVSHLMDFGAISAVREAEKLEKSGLQFSHVTMLSQDQDQYALIRSRVRGTVQRLVDRSPKLLADTDALDKRISLALDRAARQDRSELLGEGGLKMPSDAEKKKFLRDVAAYATPAFSLNSSLAFTPEDVALGATKAPDDLRGVLYLASLLTLSRAELTDRLAKLPAAYASDLRWFTPALVDYSYWLDDFENVSSLDDQVRVMSDIAALKGRRYAVHPYISFCPWRQIVEPGQLATIQKAICERGFIGVKLYPVMGFLPIGNAQAPDPETYPEELRKLPNWGQALDDSLRTLYQWCIKEEVPILAHCSQSQSPSVAAGKRGNPAGWATLLKMQEFAKLRLNLGHLGGIWDLKNSSHNDWTQVEIAMLAKYDNLYADIADYSSVMHRPKTSDAADDAKIAAAVVEDLKSSPGARDKLMYGTDWVMLSKDIPAEHYYPAMKDNLVAEWNLDPKGFLGANAARFLGLSKQNGAPIPKARQRLEAFYSKHGLDKSLLGLWDS